MKTNQTSYDREKTSLARKPDSEEDFPGKEIFRAFENREVSERQMETNQNSHEGKKTSLARRPDSEEDIPGKENFQASENREVSERQMDTDPDSFTRTEGAVAKLRKLMGEASEQSGGAALKDLDISKLILFNTQEFCNLKKIGRRTAFSWRRDGTISYLRIQGKIYYRLYDILNDLEEVAFKNDPQISKK